MSSTNLIVVTPVERDTFLVDGRLEALKSLIAPCRVVDVESYSEASWIELLQETNPRILVAGWKVKPLPADVRSEVAPALEYVCYLPGSIRHFVPRDLIEQGVLVTNWSSSISRIVAECALLLSLACMRRVAHWSHQMHDEGGWKDLTTVTQSLFDRRVGIHGFGAIAKELLPLLRPFTNKISTYTEGVPEEVFEEFGIRKADSLPQLFSENDLIIELEALTPAREMIVDEALLRSIPEGGAFVNVARGALVDEEALLRVAQEGRIQVGLDVYTVEPLPADHPFRGCRNINMLPHLGGPSTDRRRDAADHSLENVRRFKRGEPVESPITLEIYDRST
ncbi:hydroxyacid dehydrogenase [Pelagicoccus sp. SDUM812002]|uniref:hydroxyacid dehydrogenase n=1 Tax=Pelagicoccus sp. SDUM812002 TaxID=3041266 RepID=UPI00280D8571|nr:hydroxyacid dehydrogenase [Pelagicoccus sp. SDUM812002]MDQ8186747.1 hydroxyacid dehydrogenase [Pelagicoccus sp. SDUM812002]